MPGPADVREHYQQRLVSLPGSSLSAQDLYDDYCDWCEVQGKKPLPMPVYSRAFKALGVRKGMLRPHGKHARRRVYYLDIELRARARALGRQRIGLLKRGRSLLH
jgi:hypothetical protein